MFIKAGRSLAVLCGLLLALSAAGAAEKPAGPPPDAGKGRKTEAPRSGAARAKAQEEPAPAGEAARPPQDPVQITSGPEGVSLFAVSADAHELFTRLARETGFKIIVDDTIRRNITVNLVNKKVSEILDHIVGAYGFSSRQVNGIFMVSEGIPKSPSSYLLSDIDAISTQYVLAPNAKSLLPIFLQDHVKTNQEQNSVILSAPPEVLKKFRQDIAQFDIPASQILMEVLMVEFSDAGFKEFGLKFDWSNAHRQVSVNAPLGEIIYHTLVTLPTQFSAEMRALVQTGKARIRANPRIATVSGQKASIFIGKQRYLSTPVAISGGDSDFGGGGRQTNSIDAGVRLEMTPWTGGAGEIIVDIRPEISVLSAPDPKTGLPDRSTRRANTTVRVRDGETIIIGGLMQRETMSTRTKVPLLGDLPLIGWLFRSVSSSDATTEMAIFITPHILSQTGHLPADQEKELENRFLKENGREGPNGKR